MAGDKPGRKHKGDRHLFMHRQAQQEADEIIALAETRGVTRSDLLAQLVLIGMRHADELPDVYDDAQGRLALNQAS